LLQDWRFGPKLKVIRNHVLNPKSGRDLNRIMSNYLYLVDMEIKVQHRELTHLVSQRDFYLPTRLK
jgi:hypothetical protein